MKNLNGDRCDQGLEDSRSWEFFPKYYHETSLPKGGIFKEISFKLAQFILKIGIKLCLDMRPGTVGDLNKKEVEEVYRREAKKYNSMHHFTTCGQDLLWRRQAGFFVLNHLVNNAGSETRVLDLCTGTGLTVKEICLVLEAWGAPGGQLEIIGLDYSREMLAEAGKNSFSFKGQVDFVRGDATSLVSPAEGFKRINPCSIDLVTHIFGIGGIDKPLDTFREVLEVLKSGGQYFIIDMHKPIRSLPGEWPVPGKWMRMPYFEERAYYEITVPDVLKRKWAWNDTSDLFSLIRLITIKDEQANKFYGYKVLCFEPEPQRWWLSLPVMSVARMTVSKEEISEKEAKRRNNILAKQTK